MHGFKIFTRKIRDITNKTGKKRESLHLTQKKSSKNAYPTKVRSQLIISKVVSHVLKENPVSKLVIYFIFKLL